MSTLEELQQAEQWWHHILDLFTQADMALEQVLAILEQDNAAQGHPVLRQSLADVRTNLHVATDHHNHALAALQEAQRAAQEHQANEGHEHEGQEQIPDNPY
jgi:hypothetical protein